MVSTDGDCLFRCPVVFLRDLLSQHLSHLWHFHLNIKIAPCICQTFSPFHFLFGTPQKDCSLSFSSKNINRHRFFEKKRTTTNPAEFSWEIWNPWQCLVRKQKGTRIPLHPALPPQPMYRYLPLTPNGENPNCRIIWSPMEKHSFLLCVNASVLKSSLRVLRICDYDSRLSLDKYAYRIPRPYATLVP